MPAVSRAAVTGGACKKPAATGEKNGVLDRNSRWQSGPSEEDDMSITRRTDTPRLARLLTIDQVADALGVDVRHVRRLVHERRIPYIKWGHLLRFDPADIAAWVDAYRRQPRSRNRG
jgi:excisionase family DNA binding protein